MQVFMVFIMFERKVIKKFNNKKIGGENDYDGLKTLKRDYYFERLIGPQYDFNIHLAMNICF